MAHASCDMVMKSPGGILAISETAAGNSCVGDDATPTAFGSLYVVSVVMQNKQKKL